MNRILSPFLRISTNAFAAIALLAMPVSVGAQQKLLFVSATEKAYALPAGTNASLPAKATSIIVPRSEEILGTPSAIRDDSGNTHIIYTDKISGNQVVLRYLRQKGARWESAEVDGLGSASQGDGRLNRGSEKQIPPIVFDNNGNLHFAYYKVESNNLKLYYGLINPSQGMVTKALVETISSNSSQQMGLAVDKHNVVHLSYHNEGLKYANNKSGRFNPSMLVPNRDSKPDFVERGVNSAMLILPNGNILIPYQGCHNRNWVVVAEFLDCQVYADGIWKNVGIVGSLGSINTNGFNLFMNNGTPTLVYYAGGTLGFAQYTGNKWSRRTFGLGDDPLSSALSAALVSNGKPAVTWYSRSIKLYVSFRNGDTWTSKRVEGIDQYGDAFPAIVPAVNGKAEVFVRVNIQGRGTLVRVVEK